MIVGWLACRKMCIQLGWDSCRAIQVSVITSIQSRYALYVMSLSNMELPIPVFFFSLEECADHSQDMMNDIARSHCPPGDMTALMPGEIAPSVPMQGAPLPYAHTVQPLPYAMNGSATVVPYMNNEYPTHDHQNYQEPHPNIINDYEHLQTYHPQWGPQQQFTTAAPPGQDSTYYSSSSPTASSISGYANQNTRADLQSQPPQTQALENQNTRSSISNMAHSLPSPWKGEGKKELLETLFKTIGSCNEESVAQVVQVVRSSASPEDAVSGICQVLGIGESVP